MQERKMDRNTAILITAATSFGCGLPGLAFMCLGNLVLFSSLDANLPITAIGERITGTAIYLFIGLLLFAIPVFTGAFVFDQTRKKEKEQKSTQEVA
jgi:hypothetical protein